MKNNSKFVPLLAVAAAVLLFIVSQFLPGAEPIADTNGPDDISLNTLTDADICGDSLSYTSGLTISTGRIQLPGGWQIDDGVKYSASEISGIVEILWSDYILPSDFYLEISSFTVDSGNVRLVVVNNGQIVAELQPGDDLLCRLDNLSGNTSLRLAAESASFTIVFPTANYDSFSHK